MQYVLNVGDNFYPQGMNTGCGSPMNQIKEATAVQFTKASKNMEFRASDGPFSVGSSGKMAF